MTMNTGIEKLMNKIERTTVNEPHKIFYRDLVNLHSIFTKKPFSKEDYLFQTNEDNENFIPCNLEKEKLFFNNAKRFIEKYC